MTLCYSSRETLHIGCIRAQTDRPCSHSSQPGTTYSQASREVQLVGMIHVDITTLSCLSASLLPLTPQPRGLPGHVASSPSAQSSVPGNAASVDVFVGGLQSDISPAALQDAMSAAGVVLSVRLQLDKGTGKCKGYAYVSFANPASARAACSITEVRSELELVGFVQVLLRLHQCRRGLTHPIAIFCKHCILFASFSGDTKQPSESSLVSATSGVA